MTMRLLREVEDIEGKRVLVRVDFNVPMKDGVVLEDTRLVAVLPTIEYLLKKNAKIILVTHVGRPEGKVVLELRVDPIAKRLGELLGKNIKKLEIAHPRRTRFGRGNWQSVRNAVEKLQDSDIVMLENIRFSPDEKGNTGALAKELASLADLFVLDGFGVAHRASASVVGVPEHLPSYAGLLLEKEINGLDQVLNDPTPPFVTILGGIKMATKIPVMQRLLPIVQSLLVGGGIANTYFKAAGYGVGASIVDADMLEQALDYCKRDGVVLPVDVVVGAKDGSAHSVVSIDEDPHDICLDDEMILDIGPQTIALFEDHIKTANTLVWNGAVGYFEQEPYDVGTAAVAHAIAARSLAGAYTVIGGGETIQSAEALGITNNIDLVSTGGGAMLEYLSGKKLPGIAALEKRT